MIFSVGVENFQPQQSINDSVITDGVQNIEPQQNTRNDPD
jgi:hypothetical protein